MAEQGNALSPCDYYYSEKGKKKKRKENQLCANCEKQCARSTSGH